MPGAGSDCASGRDMSTRPAMAASADRMSWLALAKALLLFMLLRSACRSASFCRTRSAFSAISRADARRSARTAKAHDTTASTSSAHARTITATHSAWSMWPWTGGRSTSRSACGDERGRRGVRTQETMFACVRSEKTTLGRDTLDRSAVGPIAQSCFFFLFL